MIKDVIKKLEVLFPDKNFNYDYVIKATYKKQRRWFKRSYSITISSDAMNNIDDDRLFKLFTNAIVDRMPK